jgi:hypothetical protein
MTTHLTNSKVYKKFGFFVDERYYLSDDQEVKKMHLHFKPLSSNRQFFLGLRKETKRQEKDDSNFNPSINKNAQLMASKHNQDFLMKTQQFPTSLNQIAL